MKRFNIQDRRYFVRNPARDIYFLNKEAKLGRCKIFVNYPRFNTYVIKTPLSLGLNITGTNKALVVGKFSDKFTGTVSSNMLIPLVERENNFKDATYTFLVEGL